MDLFNIVKEHWRGITVALSLVVIENVAWIVEPALFGNVIDALIESASSAEKSYLPPLALWIGAFLVNSGVGGLRRSLDQRIFLRMFTHIATTVSQMSTSQRLSVSRTAARAQLSREFITFFQYRLPEVLEQVISIGGALIGLTFFDIRIASSCFVIILPLLAISMIYKRKIVALQSEFHDSMEETFDVFSTQDPNQVRAYYERTASPQQKIANWGAMSFGMMRIVLLGIFLVVLYISIDLDNFSTGNIYSIVAYLWTFVTSSEYIPELLESWTSLKDISWRIRSDIR